MLWSDGYGAPKGEVNAKHAMVHSTIDTVRISAEADWISAPNAEVCLASSRELASP
jgi:hypothetical protein